MQSTPPEQTRRPEARRGRSQPGGLCGREEGGRLGEEEGRRGGGEGEGTDERHGRLLRALLGGHVRQVPYSHRRTLKV